jgi:hypothetical protein
VNGVEAVTRGSVMNSQMKVNSSHKLYKDLARLRSLYSQDE